MTPQDKAHDTQQAGEGLSGENRALSDLRKIEALIEAIQQDSNNLWWVKADDPETVVCNAYAAILALASRAGAREEGWRLVPVEPTEAMVAAAVHKLGLPWREIQRMLEAYRVMLAAAPAPPPARKDRMREDHSSVGGTSCPPSPTSRQLGCEPSSVAPEGERR